MMAVLVGGLLAGLLPLSAMTTFAQPLLTTAAADKIVYVMTMVFPQPLPALAADDNTDAAPTLTVVLGNRLWWEDDFDGNATTGIVKPMGAGYVVRATASDGVTIYSATTDANGLYKLTVPANDTYIVTTDLPAGLLDTPVVTATGQNPAVNDNRNHDRHGTTVVVTTTDNLSIDFGFSHWQKQVALGDRLWLEDDNDGDAATGAVTPIGPGHVVTAVASDGVTTYSGVTDANGYYIILVPENDTYTVRTNQPTGVSDTPSWTNNGSNPTLHNDKNHDRQGTTVAMTITDNLSIDFGFYTPPPPPRTVNLGNYVWFDRDGDGTQNEPPSQGRDGITVTLTYPNNSTITTVTANDGYYTFTNLAPNQQYIVTFILPAGLVFTTPHQGNRAADSDAPSNGQVIVNLGTTDDYTIDAGLVEPLPPLVVMLGDYVWEDLNGNGQQDLDEPGIPNVTVSLTWPNGTTVVTTTTNSGFYHFTQLQPNTTYTVTFGTPAGYTPTSANTGPDANDSDPVQGQVAVPLGSNDDMTIDAGFIRPVTVGDRVWYDNNHDGRQDRAASEPGVTGVLATLYNAATNQPFLFNGAPLTDQTDANGEYLFTNLPPGAYLVVFSNLPAGYQPTLRNIGDDDGDSDADANGRTATTRFLPSGSEDRTLDMGIWRAPASLGDFVWEDVNANGVQDQGEPGLSNVTVTLTGPTGTTPTTTDVSGHYTFTNLLPGVVYTVTFATPSGYGATLTNSGSNDAIDSDGAIVVVPPLQPGEHNPTIDRGFIHLLPDLVLIKQAMTSAPAIQRGAIVTYTLTYRNQGNGVATNVVITETVSAHTRFASQKSSTGWRCNNGAPAGSQCRYALGDLQPGQSGVIVFAIQIDADVAAGTQIVNVAVIGTTQIEGVSENNKDQSTVTLVGPTDLTETQEPDALNFRLYLPVVTK